MRVIFNFQNVSFIILKCALYTLTSNIVFNISIDYVKCPGSKVYVRSRVQSGQANPDGETHKCVSISIREWREGGNVLTDETVHLLGSFQICSFCSSID